MLRSTKSQVCIAAGAFCSVVATVSAGSTIAQTSAPQTAPAVRPPVARQIEPMVAPVRRAAPKIVTTPSIAPALPPVGASSAIVPSGSAAAPAKSVAAPGSVQVAATTPKIVVYTCKIGQDFSAKLKACFTPGVTKVANAAKSLKAKVGAEIDAGKRSALGAAKRKS
jgi:hypothetical protein